MSNGGFGGIHEKLLERARQELRLDRLPARLQQLARIPQGAGAEDAIMQEQGLGAQYACPDAAAASPRRRSAPSRSVAGATRAADLRRQSSLGGFYATYLAEKLGCRAVLINPAIDAARRPAAPISGTQKNLHTGEPYELTEAHLRRLAQAAGAAHRPRSATCCCWKPATKCSTGGEAVAQVRRRAQLVIARAATTRLQSFPRHMPRILQFCGCTVHERPLRGGRRAQGRRGARRRAPASFQVESPHGRRSKIKAASVLLSFERPRAPSCSPRRASSPAALDTDFLWQCRGGANSASRTWRASYVGREPTPVGGGRRAAEAALARRCTSTAAGRGASRRRPRRRSSSRSPASRKSAHAGADRRMDGAAGALRMPAEIARAARRAALCARPQQARDQGAASRPARETGLAPARLFERCGLLPDSARLSPRAASCTNSFRSGTRFPAHDAAAAAARPAARARRPRSAWTTSAPRRSTTPFRCARVGATSCASASTSPRRRSAFAPGSALDAIARERLSTAYMPGRKFTMLPEDVIAAPVARRTAAERPAVSLYLDVGARTTALRGAPHAPRARAGRREPAPRAVRRAERRRSSRAGSAGSASRSRTNCARSGGSPRALEARRGKPSVSAAALDYMLPRREAQGARSCRASAARRSTSWSPS